MKARLPQLSLVTIRRLFFRVNAVAMNSHRLQGKGRKMVMSVGIQMLTSTTTSLLAGGYRMVKI